MKDHSTLTNPRIVMNINNAICKIRVDDPLLSYSTDRGEIHDKIEKIEEKIQQQKKSIEQYVRIQEESPGDISGMLLACYENLLNMYQKQKEEYEQMRNMLQ